MLLMLGIALAMLFGLEKKAELKSSEQETLRMFLLNEAELSELNQIAVSYGGTRFELTSGSSRNSAQAIPAKWVLDEPKDAVVDHEIVEDMLESLKNVQIWNRFELSDSSPEALKAYGLQTPELEVYLTTPSAERHIQFGTLHPFTQRRYARVDSEAEVLLLDDDAFLAWAKKRDDVRDRYPLKIATNENLIAVTLEFPEQKVGYERVSDAEKKSEEWKLEGSKSNLAEAGQEALREAILLLPEVEILSFGDDQNSPAFLQAAAPYVTIHLKTVEEELTFEVLGKVLEGNDGKESASENAPRYARVRSSHSAEQRFIVSAAQLKALQEAFLAPSLLVNAEQSQAE